MVSTPVIKDTVLVKNWRFIQDTSLNLSLQEFTEEWEEEACEWYDWRRPELRKY